MAKRPDDPIFDHLEAEFHPSAQQGWYKADLGDLKLNQDLWILSVYDRSFKTYGLRSQNHMLVVDNTHLASVSYNLTLPELGRMIAPDAFDYDDLLAGNMKMYLAEAHHRHGDLDIGKQMMLEYLIDYEAANFELLDLIKRHDFGFEPARLFSSFAAHQVVLHEVGHFSWSDGFARDVRPQIRDWMTAYAPDRTDHDLLVEETFCDLFGAVNCVTELMKEGFSRQTAEAIVLWQSLSLRCVLLLSESAQGGTGTMDAADHPLMLRFLCTQALLADAPNPDLDPAPKCLSKPFEFAPDRTGLMRACEVVSRAQNRTRSAERLSRLLLDAFATRDPYQHLFDNTVQTKKMRDL